MPPCRIFAALVGPFISAFVIDLPFRKTPRPVDRYQLILVVAEPVEDATPFGIIVGVVEPVGTAGCCISFDLNDNVRNVVARRGRALPGNRLGIWHPGDYLFDRLAAFDRAAAIIKHAIFGESGGVQIRVVKVQCEKITRLQVFG